LPVGEIKRTGYDNEKPERDRQRARQQPARHNGVARHEHVIENVDDKIEHVARPARQQLGDPQAAGKGAVDAVDKERDAEPDEHLRPVRLHCRDQCQQRAGGTAGGENVDREGRAVARRHAFCRGLGWKHGFSLHGNSRTVRNVTVVANLSTIIQSKSGVPWQSRESR